MQRKLLQDHQIGHKNLKIFLNIFLFVFFIHIQNIWTLGYKKINVINKLYSF